MALTASEFLVKIKVAYDPDVAITERDVQEDWLDRLPSNLQDHAEIVAGLVDHDSVPIQPSVTKVLRAVTQEQQ